MTKILSVLKEFLKEVEKNNPFDLVLKGGTALALYYFENHRESEDLDFDAEKTLKKNVEEIKKYFLSLLEDLKQKRVIQDYKITKSSFASTERYHIKLEIKTYKVFHSKIDIDFIDLPENLVKKGQLNLYSFERLFVTKSVTFVNRREFKDLYDLMHLIKKIDVSKFSEKQAIAELIQELITVIEKENIRKLFHLAFRNVDLRFKDLKELQLDGFIKKLIKELRILINKLKK